MKRLLLILILNSSFLIVNCFAQQYGWIDISSNVPGDSLYHDLSDLYFVSDNEGWITSSSHTEIYYTTDGGTTFSIQSIASAIDAIHMLGANDGYTASNDGSIYKTSNGGTNWNYFAPTFATLNDITFPRTGSTATGYACGDNGAIYSVTSLGADVMNSGSISNLKSITFPTDTEGWVCGQAIIRHFTNGIWQAGQTYPSGTYNAIYFTDNQNGWAVGNNGIIIHTTDGQNWVAQTNPDPQSRSLYSVFLLNPNEGWAVGPNGIILHTTNGGTTWTVEGNDLTTAFLRGVQFTSSTNGYVVGNNKTLLKYTQLTDVEEQPTQHFEFKLEQNYPNPFNPSTKINWQSPVGSWQTLKVYDVLGKEVATLVDEYKPAGSYEVEFSVLRGSRPEMASGIYFYQVRVSALQSKDGRAGDFIQTKKMILIK